MKTRMLVIAPVLVTLALAAAAAREKPKIIGIEARSPGAAFTALATIGPRSGSTVQGKAAFSQLGGKVTLTMEIRNLAPGAHAVLLHENGDCSAPDASSAGGHWNPTHTDHGKWDTPPFHMGDIGNVGVGEDGRASVELTTAEWTVGDGSIRDVVGRSIVVHEKADDFKTQPTGGAGGRVACGVITLKP